MAARAVLNRAVYTSPTDARFVCKLLRLAEVVPGQLLEALLTSASLDVSQTPLFHELLTLAPQLAQFVPETGGAALILVRLRGLIGLAPQLPESRRAAVLALLSLLHRPSTRRPAVVAALAAAAHGAVDADAVHGEAQTGDEEAEEWSDEALEDIEDLDGAVGEAGLEGAVEEEGVNGDDVNGHGVNGHGVNGDGVNGHGMNGDYAQGIGARGDTNASYSMASELLRPLMRSSLLLVEVLLPHLRDTAHPSSISLALSALQVRPPAHARCKPPDALQLAAG
jgi:hypothetical protein